LSWCLKAKASGIVLAHNHPSGNLKPSEADLSITDKLVKAGNLLDISILDHIIVTTQDYYSFSDNGIMPKPS
jgi:DNA repair protein RadC